MWHVERLQAHARGADGRGERVDVVGATEHPAMDGVALHREVEESRGVLEGVHVIRSTEHPAMNWIALHRQITLSAPTDRVVCSTEHPAMHKMALHQRWCFQ